MAAFWQLEEYHYFVERTRTKTSRPPQPPPPLHKKLPYDGEIHHLHLYKNITEPTLFFESPLKTAATGVREAKTTINSKEAAERYGGISIIDYRTKKPAAAVATAADFQFRI